MKKTIVIVLIFVLLLAACGEKEKTQEEDSDDGVIPQEQTQKPSNDIEFTTIDGVTIKGTFLEGNSNSAVLLLHELGKDRTEYNAFVQKLNEKGFTTLAIDFRGHGESGLDYKEFTNDDWQGLLNDVDSAVKYIRRTDKDVNDITIIGASIGANAALIHASQDNTVNQVVLFSPGENYRGLATLDAIRDYGNRPIMIIVSENDRYSYTSSTKLKSRALGNTKFKTYENSGHGTEILQNELGLDDAIIKWLLES